MIRVSRRSAMSAFHLWTPLKVQAFCEGGA
jgi:hypothetical protein